MTDAGDVGEDHTPPQLIAAETTVQVLPLENTELVRIGGKPGLRVHHNSVGAVTVVKRVTAGNDEPMGTMIPRDVAAELKAELQRRDTDLTLVRELLAPILDL